MKILWHGLSNSALLAVLVLILTLPVTVSLMMVSSDEPGTELSFEVRQPDVDYGEFLSYGQVAGGAAESLTLSYTAFSGFTAYYDSVYIVENNLQTAQRFKIELGEDRTDVRLFFADLGEEDGPTEIILPPGEKAAVTLAAEPVRGHSSQTGKVSFVIQSLPN